MSKQGPRRKGTVPPEDGWGDPHRHAVRQDMRRPHDQAPGTAPSQYGELKRTSEEARLVACPECGYHGGRHSRRCARWKPACAACGDTQIDCPTCGYGMPEGYVVWDAALQRFVDV